MLGKTAAHIFWMFRYLERCENTARLINASHFISLTQKQNIANHWDSILNVAGNKKASHSSCLIRIKVERSGTAIVQLLG